MAVVTEIDRPEVLAFVVGPVGVMCWHTRPTIDSLRATQELFIAHYQGRDMALLSIIETDAGPPGSLERAHIEANMKRFGPGLRGAASVIEGTGFGAAALRAVMTGIGMALRQPVPTRISASVDEAAPWLHEMFPGAWQSPGQLVQAVSRRRQAPRAR